MQNSTPLYVLDRDNNPLPVSWAEFDQWEETIAKEDRSGLGKRLRFGIINNACITTYFLTSPLVGNPA